MDDTINTDTPAPVEAPDTPSLAMGETEAKAHACYVVALGRLLERGDHGKARRLKLEVLAVVEQQREKSLTGQDALRKIEQLCHEIAA